MLSLTSDLSGGIIIFWKLVLGTFRSFSFSNQAIHGVLRDPNDSIFFVSLYMLPLTISIKENSRWN